MMIITGNLTVEVRTLSKDDTYLLNDYYKNLSLATKSKFAPHPFDFDTLHDICNTTNGSRGYQYVAVLKDEDKIIGYFNIQNSLTVNDKKRFEENNVFLEYTNCCSIAPSIADDFRQLGIGKALLEFVKRELKAKGKQCIVLLGGVQCNNKAAIAFYKKHGFLMAGEFRRGECLNFSMYSILI